MVILRCFRIVGLLFRVHNYRITREYVEHYYRNQRDASKQELLIGCNRVEKEYECLSHAAIFKIQQTALDTVASILSTLPTYCARVLLSHFNV
jgi:hypothetical protein